MYELGQKLSFFLTKAERDKGQQDFFRFLTLASELDPKNFSVFSMEVLKQRKAVVIGRHSYQRAADRSFLSDYQLQELVREHLANPLVASHIVHNMICMSDDGEIELFDNAESMTTVVFQYPYAIVYEAGFSYIRPKTVWDLRSGDFCGSMDYSVTIRKDGPVVAKKKKEEA